MIKKIIEGVSFIYKTKELLNVSSTWLIRLSLNIERISLKDQP